jgi:glycine/serine hydroxymethyltransferase
MATYSQVSRVERVLELAHIALNKNTVPGDKSAMVPGGIRMGSPALTSRGFIERDFEQVADFVHRGIQIAKTLKGKSGACQVPPSCYVVPDRSLESFKSCRRHEFTRNHAAKSPAGNVAQRAASARSWQVHVAL